MTSTAVWSSSCSGWKWRTTPTLATTSLVTSPTAVANPSLWKTKIASLDGLCFHFLRGELHLKLCFFIMTLDYSLNCFGLILETNEMLMTMSLSVTPVSVLNSSKWLTLNHFTNLPCHLGLYCEIINVQFLERTFFSHYLPENNKNHICNLSTRGIHVVQK